MRKPGKTEELFASVTAKAKELQGLVESVDLAKARLAETSAHQSRLVAEVGDLEATVAARKADLSALSDRELSFVAKIEREISDKNVRLAELEAAIAANEGRLAETDALVRERDGYLKETEDARMKFVAQKHLLDKATSDYESVLSKSKKELEDVAREKKEMGEYQSYLADYYGKVATYVIVAKDVVEQVNEAIAKGTKLRFRVPDDLLTMDNFTKTFEV